LPAADALCRAPFGGAPDPPAPPPRQRTSISTNQSAWLDSRAPSGRFRVPVKGAERRCLQSPRSTSTTAVSRAPFQHFARLPSCPAFPGDLTHCWVRSAERRRFRGPGRFSPLRASPGDDCSSPGLVTPILRRPDTSRHELGARMAGGATLAGCACTHPTRPACADLAGTLTRTASVLTGRPRLREARPPAVPLARTYGPRLHGTFRQDCLPPSPAKDRMACDTRGAFHRERPVTGMVACSANRTSHQEPRGRWALVHRLFPAWG